MNDLNTIDKSDLIKYYDMHWVHIPHSTTGAFIILNRLGGAGTDFYQRTNRAVLGQRLEINFYFAQNATAVGYYPSDMVRIIVLWDAQADVTPVASDLLLDVFNNGVTTTTTNLSHKNVNNKDRFIFLYDKLFYLPSFSITTVNQINTINSPHKPNNNDWAQQIKINLHSLLTRYRDTGGSDITSLSSGALFFFVLGGLASGSGWSTTISSRFSFTDSEVNNNSIVSNQLVDSIANTYITQLSNFTSGVTKYVDLNFPGALPGSGQFILLNGVANGNDFYQRTNRAIYCKNLKIDINFVQHETAIGYYAPVISRIIIVWDRQADTTPVIEDLLKNVSFGGVTTTFVLSHKNISNKDRFILLSDKFYYLPAYSITTTNQINTLNSAQTPNFEHWCDSVNVNLKSLVTRFSDTGSTISSISSGALYFVAFGSGATSGWSINFTSRFSYLDS